MNCDLYQNPYKTKCSGSISPDGGVSVCWRHLAESRDDWMRRANEAEERYIAAYRERDNAQARLRKFGAAYGLVGEK